MAAIVVLQWPSTQRAHFEGDEVVLTFLAERLRVDPTNYSLRGPIVGDAATRFIRDTWSPGARFDAEITAPVDPARGERLRTYAEWLIGLESAEVLMRPPSRGPDGRPVDRRVPAYDPEVYDRPFFFHPPFVPYLLAAARAAGGGAAAALVSIFAQALCVGATGLLGRRLAGETAGILAAALLALDPITWLCGARLWIDGPLQLMLTVGVLLSVRAFQNGGVAAFVVAGLACGLAAVTKMPALLAVPALVAAAWCSTRRATRAELIAGVAAFLLVFGPWLVITKVHYGAFLPAAHPSQWLIDNFPYVRMLTERPAYFYFAALPLVAPVYLLLLPALLGIGRRAERSAGAAGGGALLISGAWAVGVVAAMVVMGMMKWGFQLRYLAPAMPALCLFVAAWLVHAPRWTWLIALVFGLIGWWSGFASVAPPPIAEVRPVLLERFVLEPRGQSLRDFWPGMW